MSLVFGIKAEQQSAVADRPHIFSFATPRSVANDELVTVWNGATNAARKFAVDLNGRLHIGGLAAGDLIYGGAVLLTGTRRLESLVIGTANTVLTSSGAAPQWSAALIVADGTAVAPAYSFFGATGMGMYRIAGTGLAFAVSGIEVFRLDTTRIHITGAGGLLVDNAATVAGLLTASANLAVGTDQFLNIGDRHLTLNGNLPAIGIREDDAAADEKLWRLYADAGVLYLDIANDAVSGATPILSIDRSTHASASFTFTGPMSVTGLLTASAGITLTGTLTMATAVSILVPGATSFAVRDTANANNNLIVTNAGVLTIRAGLTVTAGGATITAGDVAITAGSLTFAAAAARLIPGATSFSLRNNANNADNVLVSDAGLVTIRAGLTVTGTITMSTAVSKIVPGATSWGVRNNADSADNLIINDAGAVVFRAGVSGMTSLTMSVGGTINLGSGGIVGALNGSITMGNNGSISAGVNGSIASGTGGFDMGASGRYKLNGTQVVGPQITGYAAMTGTPNKASVYDTATVTLPQLAGRMMQLQADLTTHGLVGV